MNSRGIAISMVYPIIKTIAGKGGDPDRFYSYASFDPALLRDAEARIPEEEFVRITAAAAEYTRDDHFGLHQGQYMDVADLGVLGYVMMHSPTIEEALAAYRRYNAIVCSSFNLEWEIRGDQCLLRLYRQSPGELSRHCAEDMAVSLHRLIGKLSNRPVPLREVAFMHAAPSDIGPYIDSFGVVPRFGAECHALRFGKETLDYPVLYSDPRIRETFEKLARETGDRLELLSPLSEQVAKWIKRCIPSHLPTLRQTAQHLGMSSRTLQERLRQEGVTYNDLSALVRKELAMGYLGRDEYSVGDVAYALHFSEQSAFQNAFKRWTGVTPGQYRDRKRQGG